MNSYITEILFMQVHDHEFVTLQLISSLPFVTQEHYLTFCLQVQTLIF
jgi:hypothetical protein